MFLKINYEKQGSMVGCLSESLALKFILTAVGIGLICTGSKINLKLFFSEVPLTLQTFAVLLVSIILGKWAIGSVCGFLFLGSLGLPVFAKGGGFLYLFGPTGGYLFGFLLTSIIVGLLSDKGLSKKTLGLLLLITLGLFLIYTPGCLWLSKFVGLDKVLAAGFFPFIVGDIIESVAVYFIVTLTWRVIKKI